MTTTTTTATATAATSVRPALRGAMHRSSVPVAICLTVILAVRASTGGARASVIVYGTCVIALLAISGVYHLPSLFTRDRRWLKRLDHSAILVATAGTYTAVIVLGMEGTTGLVLLVGVWVATVVGIWIRNAWLDGPPVAVGAVYLGVGWFALIDPLAFVRAVSAVELVLLVTGGILYTVGAILFAVKKPNPWPSTFGYHEVFHTFVVAAAFTHWVGIYLLAG